MGCSLAPFLLSFLGVLASYQGIWCIPCSGMGAADLSEIGCLDFPSGAGLGVPHGWMRCALPQPPAAPPSSSGAAVGATNPCNIREHPQGPGGLRKGRKGCWGAGGAASGPRISRPCRAQERRCRRESAPAPSCLGLCWEPGCTEPKFGAQIKPGGTRRGRGAACPAGCWAPPGTACS